MNARIWLLISDYSNGTMRVARSGNPVGDYGQTEVCMHHAETKAEMIRHLQGLARGGHRVQHMINEINATR